ncbi:MAG: thioredoxin domain-containing protein [Sphingobium sp.]
MLASAQAPANTKTDWTQKLTQTAQGAYVIGNPAAKTKLVEYVSYTCSHCAAFVAQGTGPLKARWVAPSQLTIEIRNVVRDRYDLTAALLARCGGPARFLGNHEAIFAAFPNWMQNVMAYNLASPVAPPGMSQSAELFDIAEKTGLVALMAKRGINAAQSKACLADEKTIDTVIAMTKAGIEQDKVSGTPSFLINGVMAKSHDWASLRPLLPTPAN